MMADSEWCLQLNLPFSLRESFAQILGSQHTTSGNIQALSSLSSPLSSSDPLPLYLDPDRFTCSTQFASSEPHSSLYFHQKPFPGKQSSFSLQFYFLVWYYWRLPRIVMKRWSNKSSFVTEWDNAFDCNFVFYNWVNNFILWNNILIFSEKVFLNYSFFDFCYFPSKQSLGFP